MKLHEGVLVRAALEARRIIAESDDDAVRAAAWEALLRTLGCADNILKVEGYQR